MKYLLMLALAAAAAVMAVSVFGFLLIQEAINGMLEEFR